MQRLLIRLVLVTLFIFSLGIHAQEQSQDSQDPYVTNYDFIKPPQPTSSPDKIEVVEVFLYTCPHCYAFESHLRPWVETAPSHIQFSNMPAVFNDKGILLAKAYYTAVELGILNKFHLALYDAIHVQNLNMNDEQALMQLFAKFNVSQDKFQSAFNSFSVDTKVRRAKMMTANYGISGVPSMVVNGKYRLTSGQAGGYTKMLEIVNFLVEKERAQQTSQPKAAEITHTQSSALPAPQAK